MARSPNPRFFVPDLSPKDRSALKGVKAHLIFVGESPHINEVEPEEEQSRRPLCGAAGKKWWSLLGKTLENDESENVDLSRLLRLCKDHEVAVINAVQFPLDPKVAKAFPSADPVKNLGFSKVSPDSFKKLRATPQVKAAIESLGARLRHPSVANAKIYCLGNDAEWLVTHALTPEEVSARLGEKIPHPAAWWRKGGLFGKMAKEKLDRILR